MSKNFAKDAASALVVVLLVLTSVAIFKVVLSNPPRRTVSDECVCDGSSIDDEFLDADLVVDCASN